MKIKYIYLAIVAAVLTLFACTPDDLEMASIEVKPEQLKEGVAYSITYDSENPNIVHLKSLMDDSYTPLWIHPQGRSQEREVTLRIPFEGTYDVLFGVQTRGGHVYAADTARFTVAEFCADFVNDPLWTNLTGGIGKSKVWVHDNGKYGFAGGEMAFADPSTTVEWNDFAFNWDPGAGFTGDAEIWKSTMTFSLEGGAKVSVHNASSDGTVDQEGTFMLDVNNHTITFTDAELMHTQGWSRMTSNWSKGLKVLTLTENQLQIAVMRERETSGEDPWWLVWNFVSKEYADSYVPADEPDPVPEIGGDANDILTTTKTKTWALSPDSPYDWASLDGSLLNNFATAGDYTGTGWAAYDANMIAATKFVFTSTSATGGTYVFSSYDNEDVEGTYTIDANNDITFDQPLSALISQSDYGWTSTTWLNTTAENKLRIVRTQADIMGNITDMWLGCRSTEKDEYSVYHFVVSGGGAAETDPLKAWKTALVGKTFIPDVNYFADWVDLEWKGGWTGSGVFPDNFTAQGWFWDEAVYNACRASSVTFYMDGDVMKADVVDNGTAKTGITVSIDPENMKLTFSEGIFSFSWIYADKTEWLFGSRDGANLSNVDTKGIYLGFVSGETEITMVHWVLKTE